MLGPCLTFHCGAKTLCFVQIQSLLGRVFWTENGMNLLKNWFEWGISMFCGCQSLSINWNWSFLQLHSIWMYVVPLQARTHITLGILKGIWEANLFWNLIAVFAPNTLFLTFCFCCFFPITLSFAHPYFHISRSIKQNKLLN